MMSGFIRCLVTTGRTQRSLSVSLRYSTIPKVGKRGLELQAIRAKVWPKILKNAGYRCELCTKPATEVTLTYQHVFGRNGTGAGLGAWAHVEELGQALCLSCHQKIDRGLAPISQKALRWKAAFAFAITYNLVTDYSQMRDAEFDPLETIRSLVRILERREVTLGASKDHSVTRGG